MHGKSRSETFRGTSKEGSGNQKFLVATLGLHVVLRVPRSSVVGTHPWAGAYEQVDGVDYRAAHGKVPLQ